MKGFYWVVALAALLFLPVGCGHKAGGKLTASELKAFDSAQPELKQLWSAALEASGTNDFVGGQTLLNKLLSEELSPAQRDVVSKESTALMQRLYAGVEKGDPEAQKALQEMRRSAPNRPR